MEQSQRDAILAAFERERQWLKTATKAEVIEKLVHGGTHVRNADGTVQLAPQYGGPGWELWLEQNPDSYTRGPPVR